MATGSMANSQQADQVNVEALVAFLNSAGLSADYRWTPTLALAISTIPRPLGPQEDPVILTEFDSDTLVSWPTRSRRRAERRFAKLDMALLFALEQALRLARRSHERPD